MPNPGRRLDHNLVQIDPSDRLRVTKPQWTQLEAKLGKAIGGTARRTLIKICNRHLAERKYEIEAVSIKQVRDMLSTFVIAAGAASIAVEDANKRLYRHLSKVVISVDLSLQRRLGAEGDWNEALEPRTVMVDRRTALSIVENIRIASKHALEEVEQERLPKYKGKPFEPGASFRRTLLDLQSWAKSAELPWTANNRQGTTRFSEFVFALHGCFPKHLQELQLASPGALQKRMNDAVKANRSA